MTAAQWSERLRDWGTDEDGQPERDGLTVGELDASEARELAALLEAAGEMAKALEAIEKWGGHADIESGLSCNGSWCAEQARAALARWPR